MVPSPMKPICVVGVVISQVRGSYFLEEGTMESAVGARVRTGRLSRRVVLRVGVGGGSLGVMGAAVGCGRTDSAAPARPLPAQVTFVIQSNAADNTRYWQQFVTWFGQEHTGTKVEAVVPTGEYETKVLTMLVGGSAPDLFHLDNRFIYDFNDRGLLQPLDQLLRRTSF